MSLREEIERQIKYDASDHPAVAAFFKTGTVPPMSHGDSLAYLTLWLGAIHKAVLTLAEEIDLLKPSTGEGG